MPRYPQDEICIVCNAPYKLHEWQRLRCPREGPDQTENTHEPFWRETVFISKRLAQSAGDMFETIEIVFAKVCDLPETTGTISLQMLLHDAIDKIVKRGEYANHSN